MKDSFVRNAVACLNTLNYVLRCTALFVAKKGWYIFLSERKFPNHDKLSAFLSLKLKKKSFPVFSASLQQLINLPCNLCN